MTNDTNPIEQLCREEFRSGVSAGAAARQMCRYLGAQGMAPTLRRMLEELLSEANRASFDRSQILSDFDEADVEAAQDARLASFYRLNPSVERKSSHAR